MTIIIKSGKSFDTSRLITNFADNAEQKAEIVIRKTALQIFLEVITRSPVDTGRFRANWFASLNNPSGKSTKATNRNVLGDMKAVVDSGKLGESFILTNNLPYAIALENGHSGQAPSGMARIAMRKAIGFLKANVRSLT